GILILVGGMPVTAQRRAGVPVAFVEPALLGEINITRGPATVHFGPGALGGAISIEPRWFDGGLVQASYATGGDEASLTAGFGGENFSIGIARHVADDGEAANGAPLDISFKRSSASLQYRQDFGDFSFDALLLPSRADDIGKSNSRFPTRNTTYPEDDHTLGRLRLRHANGFQATLSGHDQSLLTHNQRPGRADTFAYIESTDWGSTLQQTFVQGDFSHNIGLEYLGRRDVNGFDAQGTLADRSYSLRNAEEDAWSLFAISDWRVNPDFALEFGARYTSQSQEQAGADADDDDYALSFGGVWSPSEHHRLSLSLARGFRFATLEERYFTGVTAQGEIAGNPDLSSERSFGIDLGYGWRGEIWRGEINFWQTKVDDLIQLFELGPDLNGYTNIGEATLHGIDAAVGVTPVEHLYLQAGLTLVRSKDELTGDPLYGSPPLTTTLELRYDFTEALTLGVFYAHRFEMDRPGFEEVERDAVDLVDLDLSYRVNDQWRVQLFARNAFDEDYFATADELSTFGPERSIGLNVIWQTAQ
ncbi:MAG: TonB-dependent receptor, partial [Xanthomonadales bacterium]|nr:TonB-dependent receptor [Xanthomonadales bacterium]